MCIFESVCVELEDLLQKHLKNLSGVYTSGCSEIFEWTAGTLNVALIFTLLLQRGTEARDE
jgi:hypothetical protein